MTKKLVSILLLLLSGCSPAFKAGDCFSSDSECEKWEIGRDCKHYVMAVLEVGHDNYRVLYTDTNDPGGSKPYSESISVADKVYHKVECPKILQEKYDEFKSQSN